MSLVELNRMLKKILSLVLNYDRIARVETESIGRSRSTRESLASPETGTDQSSGGIHSTSNQMEIPDPWDDPLM
jgi:hypothetical protein